MFAPHTVWPAPLSLSPSNSVTIRALEIDFGSNIGCRLS